MGAEYEAQPPLSRVQICLNFGGSFLAASGAGCGKCFAVGPHADTPPILSISAAARSVREP